MKTQMFYCMILIILIILILFSINCNSYFKNVKDNFTNGYGFNNSLKKNNLSSIVPFNEITKSIDFKNMSLNTQLKFQSLPFVKNKFIITETNKGIINEPIAKNNVLIIPGLADYIIKQKVEVDKDSSTFDNLQVYPNNLEQLELKQYKELYNNKSGHMAPIYNLLNTLNYKENDNYSILKYDFINLNLDSIFNLFLSSLSSNKSNIIIAYDFGCIIATICLNKLKSSDMEISNKIKNCIYICPTLGGIPISIKDYLDSVSGKISKNIKNFKSLYLNFPTEEYFEQPIIIYNSLAYKATAESLKEIINIAEPDVESISFDSIIELQKLALENTDVNTIVIFNKEYNTPVSYNYKNNLLGHPENYLPKNNTMSTKPTNSILEGLQTKGDCIVPYSNIVKLKESWGKNIDLQEIKDKNHFTILKSYELSLIIIKTLN